VSILGGSKSMLLRENLKFRSSQMAGNASKIGILVIQQCTFLVILWITVYENQTVVAASIV